MSVAAIEAHASVSDDAAGHRSPSTGDRTAAVASALVFFCLSLMTWTSVHFGSFYDDEIANISILDKSFHDIIAFANSLDVHPPGQYVINKALLIVLGDFSLIKIVSGCLSAASLATLLWLSRRSMAAATFLMFAFLLATMSTVVLWDSSLRWYSYFNAVFFLAVAVLLFSRQSYAIQLLVLAITAVIQFHIGYLAICSIPILAGIFLWRNRLRLTAGNLLLASAVGAATVAICLPQAWYFVHVHMASKTTQVASPVSAFIQTAMTLGLGNSVFPLSAWAAAYWVAVMACLAVFVATRGARELDYLVAALLAFAVVFLTLSGIGLKPRNSVFLLPFMALLIASALTQVPRTLALVALVVVSAFQALGVWNVVAHANTVKGSYNTPYQAIIAALDRDTAGCLRTIVFHHDSVMSYLLQQGRFQQSTPWIKGPKEVAIRSGDCVAVIKTYRGVFKSGDLVTFYTVTQNNALMPIISRDIDEDRYAARKSMIGKETFPRFYARIDVLRAARNVTLPDWASIKYRSFFLDPNA